MVVNNWDISLPGSILESTLFVVEKGVRKNNSHPVKNHATYCNLHGGVGIPQQNLIPCLTFHFMKIIKNKTKQKNPPQTRSGDCGICRGWSWGGWHCQLRGSRPGGSSLDLVFNLAVLNPGRQAKVTEQ